MPGTSRKPRRKPRRAPPRRPGGQRVTVTWLHLSDWHQRGDTFDRQVVRDALMKDIRSRAAISPALAAVDFIVFSGDIAFSGKAEGLAATRPRRKGPIDLEETECESLCCPRQGYLIHWWPGRGLTRLV